MEERIIIKGARLHNLKNLNVEIPKHKLVVFTGVSGSGKSSLAFDTIFAEGQRRYIESLSPYARQFLGQMDRPDVDEIIGLSPAIAIDQKALSHNPRSTVGTLTEIYDYLRVLYSRLGEVFCPVCGDRIKKLSAEEMVDIILDKGKELKEKKVLVSSPVVLGRKGEYYQLLYDYLNLGYSQAIVDGVKHSLHERIVLSRYKSHTIEIIMDEAPLEDETRLFEAVENALGYSQGLVKTYFKNSSKQKEELFLSSKWSCPKDDFAFGEIEPRLFSFNSPYGACSACAGLGKDDLFLDTVCPDCEGRRLKPEALAIKISGRNIAEVCALPVDETYQFFDAYQKKLNKRESIIAAKVLKEIKSRLRFMIEVGLDYLTLDREAETLSGGEAQRIRLASQIGSQLSGALYVLDEPTIGLHEKDISKLINILKSLRDAKNTVIVVEHDEKTIFESDYLLDLGPGAGREGGEITASGKTLELIEEADKYNSLTLDYLSGKKEIAVPLVRRKSDKEKIKIIGAAANNLKNVTVEVPLRKLVCVTGVSGSGKSSLVYDVLYKNLVKVKNRSPNPFESVARILGGEYVDKVVVVDQSPIGRSPRSNPATYTGVFTPIREFFAELPSARERAYSISRFSFNVKAGRCEACQGRGIKTIEMHFLPPVEIKCEVCQAKRFNRETLQVNYKNKNISDVLEMTIDEAHDFFKNFYKITEKLKVLKDVGLGYLQLGQSATTLSGGEAQRIKLARELTRPLGKRVLYLLDEPTVGLHYRDVEMLLKVLNRLIVQGNSVVLIEHNMHVIKSADYLIDLGPGGGIKGGKMIAKGTPEQVAQEKDSFTGQHLKSYLRKQK